MNRNIEAQWVIGFFADEKAIRVMGLASQGVGYFVLDHGGRGQDITCKAAFRRAVDSPLPEHLQEVTDPFMLQKIRKLYDRRHNNIQDGEKVPYNPGAIKKIVEEFKRNRDAKENLL